MTVLYLTEPGNTLAASSRTLVVRQGTEERAQVPAVGLERAVVLAPSNLTSAAVSLCAREDMELVVMAHGARVMSRLEASNVGLILRGEQYRRAADEAFCLVFARTLWRARCGISGGFSAAPSATDEDVASIRAELEALRQRSAAAETPASSAGWKGAHPPSTCGRCAGA
jgi:CRISPR/Cas system-associated endonuclease Cas1